jgi:hypothetical protein
MPKAQLVITAVMLEGCSKRRWHETTTSPDNGYNSWSDATRPRVRRHSSRAHGAHTNARAVGPELEDRNVRLRKTLSRRGLDAGARYHRRPPGGRPVGYESACGLDDLTDPDRRSFVTPQPHNRLRSSWKRFCAELPNHCWQADVTHWHLADGGGVEILNILYDHSPLPIASLARAQYRRPRPAACS